MLEKISRVILLKDFYGPLLTDKQQYALSLHYENDLSYTEVAEEFNISRQAVYDLVRRSESLLEQYEEKLGLVEKFQETNRQLHEVQHLLDGGEDDPARVKEAVGIIRALTSLL